MVNSPASSPLELAVTHTLAKAFVGHKLWSQLAVQKEKDAAAAFVTEADEQLAMRKAKTKFLESLRILFHRLIVNGLTVFIPHRYKLTGTEAMLQRVHEDVQALLRFEPPSKVNIGNCYYNTVARVRAPAVVMNQIAQDLVRKMNDELREGTMVKQQAVLLFNFPVFLCGARVALRCVCCFALPVLRCVPVLLCGARVALRCLAFNAVELLRLAHSPPPNFPSDLSMTGCVPIRCLFQESEAVAGLDAVALPRPYSTHARRAVGCSRINSQRS